GRGRGVDAEGVLGGVPAERGGEAVLAGVRPQLRHDRGHRVQPAVVARTAGGGQAAGDAERARRVVPAQAERLGAELHRGGEARVEVDRAEVVDGDAGVVERGGTGGGDRRGGGQVGPLGDEPLVGRRGAG